MSAPDPHPPKPVERHRWLRWALDAALIVLVIVAVQLWQTRHVPFGAAPDFAGPLATGGAMGLAAWRADHPGRPVAVYFWADWCPICKAQQGSVASLAGDWPVLIVAMQSGPPAEVARVLAERGLAWPTVVDESGAIASRYGLAGVPALAVIDADGRLRTVAVGYTTALGMRARLWWASLVPASGAAGGARKASE